MTEDLDLITWLRAQLDADEAHARKDIWCAERSSNGGNWQARYGHNLPSSELWADGEIGRLTATHGRALADGAEDQHAADAMLIARMVRSAKRRAERMLREVQAKRRIIDEHYIIERKVNWVDDEREDRQTHLPVCVVCVPKYSYHESPDAATRPCKTVRLLAAPYSDRPGYRQEWTP